MFDHVTFCLRTLIRAALRNDILHVYRFDSIRILVQRGEIPQHTGSFPGSLARRTLDCELLVCEIVVTVGLLVSSLKSNNTILQALLSFIGVLFRH